ncbi:MAG: MBL fold metallo-hydrolase [Actinomycetia bacterium]|nr:MBL fold metallo-hydrolase [Actinomycetes bacterium]
MVEVTFWGVRGSTPCGSPSNVRYGGNTSCVSIMAPDHEPIVLDLGTGLRFFGAEFARGVDEPASVDPFRGTALVTHLHWDHVQGLPFFLPILRPGSELDIYGPPQEGMSLTDAFNDFMRPPYFPVRTDELPGTIRFQEVADDSFEIGRARITARLIPHIGPTLGFRIELDGATIAYLSDHQQPLDGGFQVAESALELADGADLVIHDAQYTIDEFEQKAHFGHCTIEYAIYVAAKAGARQVALFHHDPVHDDDTMDRLATDAKACSLGRELEITAAREGLVLTI